MNSDQAAARTYWQREHAASLKAGGRTAGKGDGSAAGSASRPKSAVRSRQVEVRPGSRAQRVRRMQSRRSNHNGNADDEDPDYAGPATFVNSAKVRKDHRYYRRRGPIWSDPSVHVPDSRKHLLGLRPDLERKHEAYVQSVIRKEKRAEEAVLYRRSRMRAETQDLLSARRTENLAEEERALNWGRNQGQDGDAASMTAQSTTASPHPCWRTEEGLEILQETRGTLDRPCAPTSRASALCVATENCQNGQGSYSPYS